MKPRRQGSVAGRRLILVAVCLAAVVLYRHTGTTGGSEAGTGGLAGERASAGAQDGRTGIRNARGRRQAIELREEQQGLAAGSENSEDDSEDLEDSEDSEYEYEQGEEEEEGAAGAGADMDSADMADEDAELADEDAELEDEEDEDVEYQNQEYDDEGQADADADDAAAAAERRRHAARDWPATPSPYQQALSECQDLACVTAAIQHERYPGQFRFPHFFIVGWQKCATTSLFFHLRAHPQARLSQQKEPEFFSDTCGYNPTNCTREAQADYIHRVLRLPEVLEGSMKYASAEASTHYGRNGQLLAKPFREMFPWLKIIASMREPISRAISMLAHNMDLNSKGCLLRREVYKCLKRQLPGFNYTEPFQTWLDAYPRDQLYLVQYENMTSEAHSLEVVQDIKRFLRLDPNEPADAPTLARNNSREDHLRMKGELAEGEKPDGWPIKRRQYQDLLDIVRPDAQSIAALVDKHGFGDGERWLQNWEDAWQATLDGCNAEGECIIYPN